MDTRTAALAMAAIIGVPFYSPLASIRDHREPACNAELIDQSSIDGSPFEKAGAVSAFETVVSVNKLAFLSAESQSYGK